MLKQTANIDYNSARNNNHKPSPKATPVRCAIYCRKSTSEGLDSDFSSLDAQREACQAYIMSQRGEGWTALPDRYEDGGYSGSNLERPALRRLLSDVESGNIDCIVIYKLDRLSRSLIDFTRLIDLLERKRVSFVSITQQFNSSSSMGRLTLNILLSFAQFEREIIAERTRDKMCAARRKGKWIGGYPILGYDIAPNGGRLIVNKSEARQVVEIFKLYLQHQSLLSVVKELNARGRQTKSWVRRNGKLKPGKPFTKTNLHSLLKNITYLGKVAHQGHIYKGEQGAIIDHTLWAQVQQLLKEKGRPGGHHYRNKYGALLKGLVYCDHCKTSMLHTYSKKGKNHYRYYTCITAQKQGYEHCPSKSVPALEFERFVVERIKEIRINPHVLKSTIAESSVNKQELKTRELKTALSLFDLTWDMLFPKEQARVLQLLLERVKYNGAKGTLAITFRPLGIKSLATELSGGKSCVAAS